MVHDTLYHPNMCEVGTKKPAVCIIKGKPLEQAMTPCSVWVAQASRVTMTCMRDQDASHGKAFLSLLLQVKLDNAGDRALITPPTTGKITQSG